jgi:hypothetical protein
MIAYWLPKEATAVAEWEDGAAYNAGTGWFAVADGASTGSSSREWAYTLVSLFVADRAAEVFEAVPEGFVGWVESVRARFDPRSPEFSRSRVPDWVRTVGEHTGAHATFLGGHLGAGELRAVAVGDCCLFHFHQTGEVVIFPLNDPGQFGSRPALISSLPGDGKRVAGSARYYTASLAPGDVVLAASDAFAEWLVRNASDPVTRKALARIGHRGFGELCRDLRSIGAMRNDDVTMWRASVPAAQAARA